MSNEDIYLAKIIRKCSDCDYTTNSGVALSTHFNHHHDPEWKAKWEENNKLVNKERSVHSKKRLQDRISLYEILPSICSFCKSDIPYKKRTNKFCSSACAASSNNAKRAPRTDESKKKTSAALKGRIGSTKDRQKVCPIYFDFCKICSKSFSFKGRSIRKTCSRECQTHASVGNRTYINGRRLNIYYYNKHEQKEILLESSWEENVAKFLDQNNVIWVRPTFIRWIDKEGKFRLYYPDFYLPEFDLYLDPKNPTALALSLDKMLIVEKLIPLIYGDKEMIKNKILTMI